jgi:hypothetical protein
MILLGRLTQVLGEEASHDALRILTSWTAGQASANLAEGRNP